MDMALDDTIAALASPPGAGLRGIVRMSGPGTRSILKDCFRPDDDDRWRRSRCAWRHPGRLISISSRATIAVDVYDWPNGRSYTGQPLVELHLPGSPPLLEAVLVELYRRGARPARPGEFTLRAFLAGKLDLLQAEAVLGVIDARDHNELQAALSQLAGGVSGRLSELRGDLLELLADLEAGLDFIEEDIQFVSRCELLGRVAAARWLVDDILKQNSGRMQSRSRPRVVLAGLPNAGKSTLFNRLTGQSALVSAREGTTRDYLTAPVDWSGMAFDLIDTAGWDRNSGPIAEAAERQRGDQVRGADLVLWCSAANLDPRNRPLDEECFAEACEQSRLCVRVQTQADRPDARCWLVDDDIESILEIDTILPAPLEVSAVTGHGLELLADLLRDRLAASRSAGREWLGMTAARCRESLEAVSAALLRAEESAGIESAGDELIAADVREALDHLGRILGVIYTDDILDRVFSKFCIGK